MTDAFETDELGQHRPAGRDELGDPSFDVDLDHRGHGSIVTHLVRQSFASSVRKWRTNTDEYGRGGASTTAPQTRPWLGW
jgi:hypothetical protein